MLALQRGALFDDGTRGQHLMYYETGQNSALSASAHQGCDQQTIEARAYAVAGAYQPLLVNTVVGFIGPEYLYNGKQILRAGLEDHFCGKLLGVPMGCDVCYTHHAEADSDLGRERLLAWASFSAPPPGVKRPRPGQKPLRRVGPLPHTGDVLVGLTVSRVRMHGAQNRLQA